MPNPSLRSLPFKFQLPASPFAIVVSTGRSHRVKMRAILTLGAALALLAQTALGGVAGRCIHKTTISVSQSVTVHEAHAVSHPAAPPSQSSGVQRPIDPTKSEGTDEDDPPDYDEANDTVASEPSQVEQETGFTKASKAESTNLGTAPMGNTETSQAAPSATTSGSSSSISHPSKTAKALRNVLYFTNWGIYGANYQPDMLPADRVTHVLYAFAALGEDGTVKTFDSYADVEKHYPDDSWNDKGKNAYGCVKQLYKLKQANRRLKTLISIGGWNASLNGKFANSVATDAQKQKFAETAVKLMGDWGMDGLDVDWEYPTSDTEAKSFVALLQACRKALDDYAEKNAPGYHFLLTVATSAGPDHYRQLDMKGMDQYLDAWHLMAYDYAGSWDKTTGHQANINKSSSNPEATKFSTVQAVDDYIQAGIAPDKIVLGLPLYGRSFANTNGLGESFTGVGGGTLEKGVWLYRDLPRPSAKVEMDDAVGAVWSYDASAKELVSYDDPRSAKMKVDYLKSKGLGGALFWEASGDKNKTDPDNIVSTVATSLGELENSQNQLSYPGSQYDNIKNGMKG
ncbi:Chitinase [Purpureocillium takamizusanense]|uniref:chitinase n=1 Tax=Purpureocillium takamizusanense TaxID=2060973 RepID=A0A9Q8QJL0_9HYPO|nr:Chitinase [Purpureocillium takamizusanense]UNI20978.1 Chitinase [Purpureocillium takamizusanense]